METANVNGRATQRMPQNRVQTQTEPRTSRKATLLSQVNVRQRKDELPPNQNLLRTQGKVVAIDRRLTEKSDRKLRIHTINRLQQSITNILANRTPKIHTRTPPLRPRPQHLLQKTTLRNHPNRLQQRIEQLQYETRKIIQKIQFEKKLIIIIAAIRLLHLLPQPIQTPP